MEPSKKSSSNRIVAKDRKIKLSPTSQSPSTKRSQNATALKPQYNASTSRASYTDNPTHTRSGAVINDTSNIHQTSGGLLSPVQLGQTQVDLMGLACQTFEAYELGEAQWATPIDPVDTMRLYECPYHNSILMSDNVEALKKDLNPMGRWQAEGNAEQPAILHLPSGQLSIHKDCQCSHMLQAGMGMEVEE